MQYITIFDYLLLPVYLYIFYAIVKKRSVKYPDPQERKFYMESFYLRMFGSVAYSMLVQYYYGYGDSFTYFYGSNFLTDQISHNLDNFHYIFASHTEIVNAYNAEIGDINHSGYFDINSALFIMKISAVLSYLSFNKFLIISLFFGFFSFLGQWRLYKVFVDIAKLKDNKILAWAVLYTPSIWFWGSGLMKDSICIGATGFILAIFYKFFIKRKFSFGECMLMLFCIFLVANIKSYIIIIITVALMSAIFLSSITSIKNVVIKAFIVTAFFLGVVAAAFLLNFNSQLQALAEESLSQTETFQQNYQAVQQEDETSRAGIEVKEIDPTISGLIKHCPVAIFNCLFRPFLWESRKVIILFTALESSLLLFSTLYLIFKMKFFGFFKAIFADPYLFFCFAVSILFALIIGFTTYNFGTMIRYKIILLPFYYFLLVSLYKLMRVKKVVSGK